MINSLICYGGIFISASNARGTINLDAALPPEFGQDGW